MESNNFWGGYTKNQAMKKKPMVMRTRAKWGYTDGLMGLTYGDMLSCKGRDGKEQRRKDKGMVR